MRSFAIIAALGLLVSAVLAVSANYPFDALPLPVQPATSSGEVNRQAYELNGTVKVSIAITFKSPVELTYSRRTGGSGAVEEDVPWCRIHFQARSPYSSQQGKFVFISEKSEEVLD